MNYYLSDPHIGHNKPFIVQKRGYTCVEEHDQCSIDKINKVVTSKDVLTIIGDFCFNNNYNWYFNQLKCKLILLYGNHDRYFDKWFYKSNECTFKNKLVTLPCAGIIDTKLAQKYPVTLCHYPMRRWNKSHFDSFHLYGHLHYATDFGGKTLNISVDSLNGIPISEYQVIDYMLNRPHNEDYIERT